MATSRIAMLAALAASRAAPLDPIAGYAGPAIEFDEPVAAFREALAAAGGALAAFPDRASLDRALADAPRDTAVVLGGLAVAESGAVWWVPRDEAERREAFLAERMIVVVERGALVSNLHEAYRRIDPAASHYGCFVAGPSKTADIEQALVIGAHGPRALAVYLWG